MADNENKHTHGHHHGHSHDDPHDLEPQSDINAEQMDAGTKSLTDALRMSFMILKVIIIILILLFFASGLFRVRENEKALVLQFGRIKSYGDSRVLGPGFYWAWPEPINKLIRIPAKKVQTLPIDSFWYFQTEEEKVTGKTTSRPGRTLNPTRDGYSLTRNESIVGLGGNDYNIVHSKWVLNYRIDFPEKFYTNIYYRDLRPGEGFLDAVVETVNPMLKDITSDAVVTTLVDYSIDEAVTSNEDIANNVAVLVQDKLDAIDSGITVVDVQAADIRWPRQVDQAFLQSNKAKQESSKIVDDARAYAEKILNEAGGSQVREIIKAIENPDISKESVDVALEQLTGSSKEIISDAMNYRTSVAENARANYEYMRALLPEFRQRPQLVVEKIYQDRIEEILEQVDEKFVLQSGPDGQKREIRLRLNRDPSIKRKSNNQQND